MRKETFQTKSLIVLFFILILNGISNCSDQAIHCTVTRNNLPGECKAVRNCSSVFRDLQNGIRDYTRCAGSRHLIVCCPLPYVPPTNPTTTQPEPQRLHERKCNEYQKYVYSISNALPLTPFGKVKQDKIDKCGFKTIELISGGVDAKPKEFPHMAALGWRKKTKTQFLCGGSLISERFILTAAHCMKQSNPHIVRLGDLNINSETDDANPEDIPVQQVFIHPNYNANGKTNDIALIKLERDVHFDEYKRPACLSAVQDWEGIDAIAIGWGHTDSYDIYGADHLQKVKIQKFEENECQVKYSKVKDRFNRVMQISYSTQVCVGSRSDNRDSCRGDSGGPLQVLNPKEYCMWDIVGITSFGPSGCGNKGTPGIYTRVFSYIDWIENIVWS